MQYGVQIIELLCQVQVLVEQWIVYVQDLCYVVCLVCLLFDVQGQLFGGQVCCQWQVDECGVLVFVLEVQCGVGVFGDCFYCEVVGFVQCLVVNYCVGVIEEGGVLEVVVFLYWFVEQFVFVGQFFVDIQVVFEWILGIEIMWCLYYCQFGVIEKVVYGGLQKIGGGNMVVIEYIDQFIVGLIECVVQVVGFGVLVIWVGDVVYFGVFGECFEIFLLVVIKYVDVYFVGWVIQVLC